MIFSIHNIRTRWLQIRSRVDIYQSAYEVKTGLGLFERRFKMEKSGVFLFFLTLSRSRDIHDFVLCKLAN